MVLNRLRLARSSKIVFFSGYAKKATFRGYDGRRKLAILDQREKKEYSGKNVTQQVEKCTFAPALTSICPLAKLNYSIFFSG